MIDKLLARKIVGVVQLVWWSQLIVVASSKLQVQSELSGISVAQWQPSCIVCNL